MMPLGREGKKFIEKLEWRSRRIENADARTSTVRREF